MATSRSGRGRGRRTRRGTSGQPASRGLGSLPYSRRNVHYLVAGLASILVGYVCLAQPPVNGFLSLTLAPILLVAGYCVLIPIGLLIGGKKADESGTNTAQTEVGG